MSENRDEQFKEVCAQYGVVMYFVQVFENEVANANLCIDLAPGLQQAAMEEADRTQASEPFIVDLQNLVERLNGLTLVPATLVHTLDQAKSRRDFLTNRFFRDRAESFYMGRSVELLQELEAHGKFFSRAEKKLQDFMAPLLLKLGYTKANVQGEFDMYFAEPASRTVN